MIVSHLLRKATISDIPQVLSCFKDAILAIDTTVYSDNQKYAWINKGFENQHKWVNRIETQYFLVAEVHNMVVGFSSISDEGYVDLLFTSPKFQRQGIASALYKELENFASINKLTNLETHASAISKKFFELKGFLLIDENEFELNGTPISNFHLSKQLH